MGVRRATPRSLACLSGIIFGLLDVLAELTVFTLVGN
jgi:hypothetical protein